jgi:hypothetical protein
MEGGRTFSQRVCSEKALGRRFQDEGGVEAGGGAEMELLTEPGERQGGACAPSLIVLLSCGENAGDEFVAFADALKWCVEDAGPPCAVGSQIELEVVTGNRIGEEKLGDIVLPELGLEVAEGGVGMTTRRAPVFRHEVEALGVVADGEVEGGIQDRSKPVSFKRAERKE